MEFDETTPICHCCRVNAGQILKAVEAGHTEFQEVSDHTGAAMGCGSCIYDIDVTIRNAKEVLKARKAGQPFLPFS